MDLALAKKDTKWMYARGWYPKTRSASSALVPFFFGEGSPTLKYFLLEGRVPKKETRKKVVFLAIGSIMLQPGLGPTQPSQATSALPAQRQFLWPGQD